MVLIWVCIPLMAAAVLWAAGLPMWRSYRPMWRSYREHTRLHAESVARGEFEPPRGVATVVVDVDHTKAQTPSAAASAVRARLAGTAAAGADVTPTPDGSKVMVSLPAEASKQLRDAVEAHLAADPAFSNAACVDAATQAGDASPGGH